MVRDAQSRSTRSTKTVHNLVKKHTYILVPRVFAWSSDSSNPVAAEYIVMEKAPGVPLFQVWGTMTEFEKLQLIKNLTQLEAQFAKVKFPVYGGLYLRTDQYEQAKHASG